MIFASNTTALGATTIPMAEGYDCSYGASLALVESARNDFAVFKAMVQADYREMAICKESTGVVQEGEITALREAVGGGIFKKIAELFRKLVAKIKSIFHNFMARIRSLYMKDKDLVKKYQKELLTKRNVDKLEVKWRKGSASFKTVEDIEGIEEDFDGAEGWNEEVSERDIYYMKAFTQNKVSEDSIGEFTTEIINAALEDEETVKLGEVGGIRGVCRFLSEYDSKAKKMESAINKATTKLEQLVKEYDKKQNEAVKVVTDTDKDNKSSNSDKEAAGEKLTDATKQYDMALSYQRVALAVLQVAVQVNTIVYKQNKAALMKAITVNEKKLEESSIYAQAVAEAAEDEVDNVINSALSDEEISKLSAASTNVMDGGVSNDPDKLTYAPDCYTNNASFSNSNGSIDSSIGGGKVEESYFGGLFY